MVIGYERFDTGIVKVFFRPTNEFPEGKNYIYMDSDDLHLILDLEDCSLIGNWDKCAYPSCGLYRKIAAKHIKNESEVIDHINGVGIDNTSGNLRSVTYQDNGRNRLIRGYSVTGQLKFTFSIENTDCYYLKKPGEKIRDTVYRCNLHYGREDLVAYHKKVWENAWWKIRYDFFLDRRGEFDLLELEYSGQISHQEAVFRHVMKKARDNAWYVYRYHLFDYFDEHGIPIPEYELNEDRRMVDIKTGQLLCPMG